MPGQFEWCTCCWAPQQLACVRFWVLARTVAPEVLVSRIFTRRAVQTARPLGHEVGSSSRFRFSLQVLAMAREPHERSAEKRPQRLSSNATPCPTDAPGNVDDDAEMQEVYSLLTENYVEDDALCLGEKTLEFSCGQTACVYTCGPEDSMFRFDYSIHFLRWALKPPEFLRRALVPAVPSCLASLLAHSLPITRSLPHSVSVHICNICMYIYIYI